MEGIFGVGLFEILLIMLILFIVGGPENTAKWAREVGRYVGKLRQQWQHAVKEFEKELGPEGKELLDASRELSQNLNQVRRASSPRRLVTDTTRKLSQSMTDIQSDLAENTANSDTNDDGGSRDALQDAPNPASDTRPSTAESTTTQYRAWLPLDDLDE
ncbi:MAG: hypothetical protein GYB65_11675 [Chloroflexi bacterium]|nr:hypothetical protein [Chloroflexota bacterium]